MRIDNELGVIVEFSRTCLQHGYDIESVQSSFPDAIIYDTKSGRKFTAEFEYRASNFVAHKHDFFGCDVIICWINDLHKSPITVWELSGDWWELDIKTGDKKDIEIFNLRHQVDILKNIIANNGLQVIESDRANSERKIARCIKVLERTIEYHNLNPEENKRKIIPAGKLNIGRSTWVEVMRLLSNSGFIFKDVPLGMFICDRFGSIDDLVHELKDMKASIQSDVRQIK